jgi:hypothetical protein
MSERFISKANLRSSAGDLSRNSSLAKLQPVVGEINWTIVPGLVGPPTPQFWGALSFPVPPELGVRGRFARDFDTIDCCMCVMRQIAERLQLWADREVDDE